MGSSSRFEIIFIYDYQLVRKVSCIMMTLSKTPDLYVGLGGRSGFLTCELKDGAIFDILDHLG